MPSGSEIACGSESAPQLNRHRDGEPLDEITKIQCMCLIIQLRAAAATVCATASPLLLRTRARGEQQAVMVPRMKHPPLSNVPPTGQGAHQIPRLGRESLGGEPCSFCDSLVSPRPSARASKGSSSLPDRPILPGPTATQFPVCANERGLTSRPLQPSPASLPHARTGLHLSFRPTSAPTRGSSQKKPSSRNRCGPCGSGR